MRKAFIHSQLRWFSSVPKKLRLLRDRLATERAVPLFVVAKNDTLRRIAEANPSDIDGLGGIRGVGPYTIITCGPAIIDALSGR